MKIISTLQKALIVLFISQSLPALTQKPVIEPAPSWIETINPKIDAKVKETESTGYYYLLIDQQEHIANEAQYNHYAYVILSSEGAQQMSDISASFDPVYQKLIFHKIIIHRNGEKINQLTQNNIQTIQREQSMDRYLYDGTLTSIVKLKDIRVGDVIEYAYTIKGYNPIYKGWFSQRIYFNFTLPYEQFFSRIITPTEKKLTIGYHNGETKPEILSTNNFTEYRWILNREKAVILDNNLPSWYDPYRYVMISEFTSWSDVSKWATEHFHVSEAEKQSLKLKFKQLFDGKSSEELILSAVRFVQDEIRYLGFETGLNSHKPHSPIKVYDQRFGDCKDKSLLLCTILQAYDIEAYPVLVNTNLRHKTPDVLPAINAFDHCVVQVNYEDDEILIDPTISNQGGTLYENYFPNYGSGLVISPNSKDLTVLPVNSNAEIIDEETYDILEIGGEAILSIKTTYRGIEADNTRKRMSSANLESIQKSYRDFYANLYHDIVEEEPIKLTDDRIRNEFIIEEKYRIPTLWKSNDETKEILSCEFYSLSIENLVNISKSTTRPSPYQLNFPLSYQHYTRVNLPEEWSFQPNDLNINSKFYSYIQETTFNSRQLTLFRHYKTLSDHIPTDALQQFVEDHKLIMNNLSYSLTHDSSLKNVTGINTYAALFAVFLLIVGILLAKKLFRYDPTPELSEQKGESIGGWLILVAIGLTITPFRLVWDILITQEFFSNQTWISIWNQKQWGLFVTLTYEIAFNVLFLIFSILVLILFYQRRSSVPLFASIFYAANFGGRLVDILFVELLTNVTSNTNFIQELTPSIISALIWIPYFNFSERVKETFVGRAET